METRLAQGWTGTRRQRRLLKLFQTFPRKGMETAGVSLIPASPGSFFKLFPARGWKPHYLLETSSGSHGESFSNFSPQGDGNISVEVAGYNARNTSFSNFSPQGDGNFCLRRLKSDSRNLSTFSNFSPQGDGNIATLNEWL